MLPILFSSTDVGAPALTSGAGALVGVLDACLVTGFNPHSVASITLATGVATLTTNLAHGYKVGDFLSISAAAGLSGVHKVQSVPSTTSLTFLTAVSAADQGSGAQVKKAPLGWQKRFADGSTKAIYQSTDVQAYGQCLVLDDTGVTGHVYGAEAASAIDNYINAFPAEGRYWPKPSDWFVVGDGRIFYFLCGGTVNVFGDIASWRQGDVYGAILSGDTSGSYSTGGDLYANKAFRGYSAYGGSVICRDHTGLTLSCPIAAALLGSPSDGSAKALQYPSPIDGGAVFLEPAFIAEKIVNQAPALRGILPGVADFFASADSLAQSQTIASSDGSGETFFVYKAFYGFTFSIRISSDWREA